MTAPDQDAIETSIREQWAEAAAMLDKVSVPPMGFSAATSQQVLLLAKKSMEQLQSAQAARDAIIDQLTFAQAWRDGYIAAVEFTSGAGSEPPNNPYDLGDKNE